MSVDSEGFICLDDFVKPAQKLLLNSRVEYFRDGCNEQYTLKENREAFKRYRLRPRLLRDVSKVDLSTTVLGQHISWPVGISPTALHRVADYDEGEKATARAAYAEGSVMVLSCFSTCTIEDVAKASPHGLLWMQVMLFNRREITESLVKRAEAAGFKAIVVTIDQPVSGKKYSSVRNRESIQFKLQAHEQPINLKLDIKSAGDKIVSDYSSVTWEDIKWLKSLTKLPLVLKGITTGDQACNAVKYGASGILVSNHGGRQLDYLPATGYEGAKQVLSILKEEVASTMALMGCTNVSEIAPSMVVHEDYFKKSKL
ncbi:hydroxyacid oxidase 1-like isoform X2 [Anneissia japonica]|uniref:hydroxyacid oxidase 1-like isoform X2 n=1 Tax=Anneissia japonica TaxID=1529436 RepID=UPI001425514B|nr:hydroxyacid oxidase 1-like isoform X2 [Anneissia japonica]